MVWIASWKAKIEREILSCYIYMLMSAYPIDKRKISWLAYSFLFLVSVYKGFVYVYTLAALDFMMNKLKSIVCCGIFCYCKLQMRSFVKR
jgi:hypothetical protein